MIHPIVEVIVEIAAAGLSGSLKISKVEQESHCLFWIWEFVLFHCFDERAFRLLEFLLADGGLLISENSFSNQVSNAPNDLELAERIVSENGISVLEMNKVVPPSVRVDRRGADRMDGRRLDLQPSLAHSARTSNIISTFGEPMIEYSRKFSPDAVAKRFKSMNEWFVANAWRKRH